MPIASHSTLTRNVTSGRTLRSLVEVVSRLETRVARDLRNSIHYGLSLYRQGLLPIGPAAILREGRRTAGEKAATRNAYGQGDLVRGHLTRAGKAMRGTSVKDLEFAEDLAVRLHGRPGLPVIRATQAGAAAWRSHEYMQRLAAEAHQHVG